MKIQEEFTNELIPGETYYFNYRGKTVSGKFKRATMAWKIFEDDNGNEMLINSWSNVATTPEDIEGVERAVDSMEKDIKLPSRVPNKDIKAPNRHGFVESKMDLTSDIQRATDAIVARKDKYKSNDALCDSIYSAISDCLQGFQFVDKDKNEVLNDIYQKELKRLNIEDTLNESNELEKRAKKHKKKSKGMSMFGLKPDAGNVEINNKVFNAMNNVNNSPSTNPTGPMGEEMTKLEAMTCLNRLNEENSNERDFAIYCNNAFGKYKVATWKATDAETAVAEFKELNPKYTKTGLITAVEI